MSGLSERQGRVKLQEFVPITVAHTPPHDLSRSHAGAADRISSCCVSRLISRATSPPQFAVLRLHLMSSSKCIFCQHSNPIGAKYCNECAAPLHLKPCQQCDAVNDRSALNCYKCGADLPVEAKSTEVPAESVELESAAGFVPIIGFEPERQSVQGATAEEVNTFQRPPHRDATQVVTNLVEFFAHERSLGRGVTPLLSSPNRIGQHPARSRRISWRFLVTRVALPMLLVAGVATASYLAYHHPDDGGDATAKSEQDARTNHDGPADQPVAASAQAANETVSVPAAKIAATVAAEAIAAPERGAAGPTGTTAPPRDTSADFSAAPASPSSGNPTSIAPQPATGSDTQPNHDAAGRACTPQIAALGLCTERRTEGQRR